MRTLTHNEINSTAGGTIIGGGGAGSSIENIYNYFPGIGIITPGSATLGFSHFDENGNPVHIAHINGVLVTS